MNARGKHKWMVTSLAKTNPGHHWREDNPSFVTSLVLNSHGGDRLFGQQVDSTLTLYRALCYILQVCSCIFEWAVYCFSLFFFFVWDHCNANSVCVSVGIYRLGSFAAEAETRIIYMQIMEHEAQLALWQNVTSTLMHLDRVVCVCVCVCVCLLC